MIKMEYKLGKFCEPFEVVVRIEDQGKLKIPKFTTTGPFRMRGASDNKMSKWFRPFISVVESG